MDKIFSAISMAATVLFAALAMFAMLVVGLVTNSHVVVLFALASMGFAYIAQWVTTALAFGQGSPTLAPLGFGANVASAVSFLFGFVAIFLGGN